MNDIVAITKREFRAYFDSPIAYVFMTVFLVLTGWLFYKGFFISDTASIRMFFSLLPWVFLFFIPAVTMRLWSEEKKLGTMELLMTLPLRDIDVVIGKFTAAFLFLTSTVILTFPLVISVNKLGNPDPGPIIGGYIGAILMGGAYLAIGMFASSLTENQITSFILGVVMCFILFIIGEIFVLMAVPYSIVPLLKFLGLGSHFESIGRGVLDSRDLLYYLSVIVFFLFLNIRSLESRQWK
ncbi:ABC transporter permease subunit [bacterium]|nr:ABC transporter permease subunit [candidate division CSSED10-310 bacterium]